MTAVTKTHLEEVWERVAQMPPRADGARWVPRDAIKVQPGLTPRERMIDEDHVARLAENKDGLPPLLVQAGTLVLIGGHHRLYALEGRDIVPVVEVEVEDGDLWDWAVRDNVAHGLPATARERNKNARKMWERHYGDWEWTLDKLAEWTGVHRSTFAKWNAERKHQDAIAAEPPEPETLGNPSQSVEKRPIAKSVTKSPAPARKPSASRSFDPGRGDDAGWEEPSRQVDTETGEVDDDEHVKDSNTEVSGGVILSCQFSAMVGPEGEVLNIGSLMGCVTRMKAWLDGLVEVYR